MVKCSYALCRYIVAKKNQLKMQLECPTVNLKKLFIIEVIAKVLSIQYRDCFPFVTLWASAHTFAKTNGSLRSLRGV
jgi:hypothetical protein